MILIGRRFFAAFRMLLRRLSRHQTALVAAGCAFYGTLALFPALATLVSLYGLFLNPSRAVAQLGLLRDLLPVEAWQLIATQIDILVQQPRDRLGLGLVASILATLWSASSGTTAMRSISGVVKCTRARWLMANRARQ